MKKHVHVKDIKEVCRNCEKYTINRSIIYCKRFPKRLFYSKIGFRRNSLSCKYFKPSTNFRRFVQLVKNENLCFSKQIGEILL